MATDRKAVAQALKKKAARTWVHKLPSGVEVTLRRPSWMVMMKQGLLPNHMFELVMEKSIDTTKTTAATAADFKDRVMLMQAYALAGCVTPKIVLANPKEDEVLVDDLDDMDLVSIFNKVSELLVFGEEGEGDALKSFSEGKPSVDAGQHSPTVQPEAVGADGSK